MQWQGKRFHSLNCFLRDTFGGKTVKISLDAGFTCPNRDGTLSWDGCIFCSGRGSGDFAFSYAGTITDQFHLYKQNLKNKWPEAKYIAYFQAYTNTYGCVDKLRTLYYEALALDGVQALSIATRPDCLGPDVLELLREIAQKSYLFVELGFQSSKAETVERINRRYENILFDTAVKNLKAIGANVVTHIIIDLPGESKEDMFNTVNYVLNHNIDGLKLHQLYVLKNTKLAQMYANHLYTPMSYDCYIDTVVSLLEIIPEQIVIHRLTGDAPKKELIAPLYGADKRSILNAIDKTLAAKNTWQGKLYNKKLTH